MNHHLIDDPEIPKHERELTLSTGSILAIFLVLVLLCGAFFGFGYNMGRKSAPTPLNLAELPPEPTLPSTTSAAAKPPAGSPLDASSSPTVVTTTPKPTRKLPAPTTTDDETSSSPTPKPTTTRTPVTTSTQPAPIVRQPAPVSPAALNPSAAGPPIPGNFVVQVAAVSHQEDADLLVGALRARGYSVTARPSSADNFIHVQVGPFHDKRDADAMRQRLLTDGYNAIVKQ